MNTRHYPQLTEPKTVPEFSPQPVQIILPYFPLINFNVVLTIFLGCHVIFPGSYKKGCKYIQFSTCEMHVPTTFILVGWCSIVTELWSNKLWGCKKLQRSAKLRVFLQWITFPNLHRTPVSYKLCSPSRQLKFKHVWSLSEGRNLQRQTTILLKTYTPTWAALLTIPLKGMTVLLKQATFISLQWCAQRRILVSYQSSVRRCSPAAKIQQYCK